jgi:hypothetical protein
MKLFTRIARRRWLHAQIERARIAWRGLARLWQAAFAAELDGHGEPMRTLRVQLAMARCRFRMHEYARALTALGSDYSG